MVKFFFVNKNASSTELTRSNKNEKTLLLSHVQSKRRLQASAARANRSHTAWITSTDVDIEEGIVQYKSRVPGKQNAFTPVNAGRAVRQISLAHRYAPKQNCLDPFNVTVAAEGLIDLLMFEQMKRSTTANVYLAHASAPTFKRPSRIWTRHMRDERWLMEASMSDSMVMYANLLNSCYMLKWMRGQDIERRNLEDYTGKCLQAVRLSLRKNNNVADQKILRTVLALALTSLWDGLPHLRTGLPVIADQDDNQYLDSCKMHLIAFVSLLEGFGGWNTVLPSIRDGIILTDRYRCIVTLSVPIIDDAWFPNPLFVELEFGDSLATDDILPHMGAAFENLAIHHDLRGIMQDVVDFSRIAEWLWSSDVMNDKNEEWLFLRLASFFHRLLSLQFTSAKDKIVRIALLLFLMNTTDYYGAQLAAITLLGHIKSCLETLRDDDMEESLRFWILCTASMTVLECPARDWFDRQLILMVEHLPNGGISVREFRARLLPTLYIPLKLDHELRVMVERLREVSASSAH